MPLFVCSKCGCVENTACSGYHWKKAEGKELTCSECDTGKWHGEFPKRKHNGVYNDSYMEYTSVFGFNTGKSATIEEINKKRKENI